MRRAGKQTQETALGRSLARSGMSQMELADRSGVARETINKIANGKFPTVRTSVVVALAWALDVALEELADHVECWPLGPRSEVPEWKFDKVGRVA